MDARILQSSFGETMTPLDSSPSLSNYTIIKQIGSGSFGQIYLAYRNALHYPTNLNSESVNPDYLQGQLSNKDSTNQNKDSSFQDLSNTQDASKPKQNALNSKQDSNSEALFSDSQSILKKINLSLLTTQEEQDSAWHEVEILKLLSHPNIIKYQGAWIEDGSLWIEMEYAKQGDLHMYITECKERQEYLPEEKIWKWFVQLCLALKHCHDKNILHRDIKTQNIFICDEDTVKLGDFGISKILSTSTMFAQTQIGSPFSMSPEVCEDKPYNQKSDIWSLGCVLYEMCTLNHAFDAKNLCALILRILRGKYPPIPDHYSENLKDLISAMLQQKPEKRPHITEILGHPFVQNICTQLIMDVNKVAEHAISTRRGQIKETLLSNVRKNKNGTEKKGNLGIHKTNQSVGRSDNRISETGTQLPTSKSTTSKSTTSKRVKGGKLSNLMQNIVSASVAIPSQKNGKRSQLGQASARQKSISISASVSIPRQSQEKKKPSLDSIRRKRLENPEKSTSKDDQNPDDKIQWFDQVRQDMKQLERMMNPLEQTMMDTMQKENILKEKDILKQQKIEDRKRFIEQQMKKNVQASDSENSTPTSEGISDLSPAPNSYRPQNDIQVKKVFRGLNVKNDLEQRKKEYLKERRLKKKQKEEEERMRIKEHKKRMKEIEKGNGGARIVPEILQNKGRDRVKKLSKPAVMISDSSSVQSSPSISTPSSDSNSFGTPRTNDSPSTPGFDLEKKKQKIAEERKRLREFIQQQKKHKGRASVQEVEIIAPRGSISFTPEEILVDNGTPVPVMTKSPPIKNMENRKTTSPPSEVNTVASVSTVSESQNTEINRDNARLSIRIEQLRKECEECLGEKTFFSVYDLIRQNSESLEMDSSNFMSQITQVVPPNKIQFITLVHQLIFCEDKFYR